jgi:predicted nuclease of restriction endonuclease-like (RecB) superfamily
MRKIVDADPSTQRRRASARKSDLPAANVEGVPKTYPPLLADLKQRIREARIRASLAVNRELVLLYWSIGREIVNRQQKEGWGTKVIERLASDLRKAFPEMTGFSARNLGYMRSCAEAWPDESILQQVAAKLPWGHIMVLIDAVKSAVERDWYARQAIEHGWSRNVMALQIDGGLFNRQGGALTNFQRTLPAEQSELAQQIIKDPYNFDFLSLTDEAKERAIERGMIQQVQSLILELGKGFAFVGSQYPLEVGGQDYYLDLLFYHYRLRCFVVIELKVEAFKPQFAGKMNFYLSAIDDLLRHPEDRPSIGIILCKDRKDVVVEYALKDSGKPMGVAQYRLSADLPERLKDDLPSPEDLAGVVSAAREALLPLRWASVRRDRLDGELLGTH